MNKYYDKIEDRSQRQEHLAEEIVINAHAIWWQRPKEEEPMME